VLRIRFHGRGGHGVKTASRILGTAAFLSGLHAQDSPVYGAERRGAAVAAFTRIDARPVRERGVIVDPDLIVVADETLLADPAAGVLKGAESASAVLVNTPQDGQEVKAKYQLPCAVLTADLTALTMEILGKRSALSAPLGAVACALAGVGPVEVVLGAVRDELEELGLGPEMIEKNLEVARRAHSAFTPIEVQRRQARATRSQMHRPVYTPGVEGISVVQAPGNSAQRHTGSWRLFRPVIDLSACTRCGICFALCPDGAISLDANGYPVIDYDNCKGCMICSHECPIHCIAEQKEVRAW
jgi:pyruvate ferredoxin oxidoreductase gamma subunit